MANTTADKTPISLDNLARNNERMKEYIQSEIDKIPTGGSITIDNTLSDISENPVQNKVIKTELDKKADITDIPTSLPANGGDADTVNNHTVNADVPADAVFTDTVEYKDAFGSPITLDDACDASLINLKLFGKSTQNGTPTPDNPVEIVSVGDSGSLSVQSCGKNLLNYDAWKTVDIYNGTAIFENNGITITATTDDAYTQFLYSHFPKLARVFVIEGETITLSWEESTNTSGLVYIFPNGKLDGYVNCNNSLQKKLTYTVPSGVSFIVFRFGVSLAGDTISYKNIMIERSSEATEFEPYKGNTASITSALPLCGIPVNSGGNYTDSNGQQWICDELIYNADGSVKNVKRTAKIDSYNGEAIATPFISTTGSMTTGATVIYQLAEPQEIELTATEMASLRQLQTYNGVTNISNDGIAEMYVKYWRDDTIPNEIQSLNSDIETIKSDIETTNANVSAKLSKSGGTMTGSLFAYNTSTTSARVRNIQITDTDLTAGSSSLTTGTICLVYE